LVDGLLHLVSHYDLVKIKNDPLKKAMMITALQEEISLGWMHDRMQQIDGKRYFG
jgi:hypothetical protein